MPKYIIVAENLGNIEPLLSQLGPWGRLSSTTYYSETSQSPKQIYNHFNLRSGSDQQLHIIGASSPYIGFGLPEVIQHLNKMLN